MDNSKTSYLHLFLIFALLIHGALYFLTGDIYNKDNPVKLLKYIVTIFYFFSISFFLRKVYFSRFMFFSFLWVLSFILLLSFSMLNSLHTEYVVFLLIPFLYILLCSSVNILILSKTYQVVLFIAFVFMILEFLFFFDISSRFNRSGFRSISIFVNPNAFGATVVLLFVTVIYHIKSKMLNFVNAITSCCMVLLSGSKTAIVAFSIILLSIALRFFFCNRLFAAAFFCVSILFSPMLILFDSQSNFTFDLQLRALDLASGGERLKAFSEFSAAANECFFLPVNCNELIYVDNAFISSWIYLGIPGLLIILGVFISSVLFSIRLAFISSNYYFISFFSLFWLMAISTNLMNIWPTAYLFWITYGYMLNVNIKRTSYA